MSPVPCVPSCCNTPQVVNVPGVEGAAGTDGANGAAGANGVNAFTTTTANFNVPAANASVTFSVANSSWMAVGQTLVVDGPATLFITAIPTATSVTATWVQASGDVATGTLIASGAKVSPSGPKTFLNDPATSYGSGAPQSLTTTPAQILSVQVTLPNAGHYLLCSRARCDLNGATYASVKTLTTKIRRTNNTPADITNASTTQQMPIVTTLTFTLPPSLTPLVKYVGAAGDILQLFGSVNTLPSAGSVDVNEAELIALQIS